MQRCETAQWLQKPRQRTLFGILNPSAFGQRNTSDACCSKVEIEENSTFSRTPLKYGRPTPPSFLRALLSECNLASLFYKTLHPVQSPDSRQPPQRAWAEAWFAAQPGFAQKRDAEPVGGRGISAFWSKFFRSINFASAMPHLGIPN